MNQRPEVPLQPDSVEQAFGTEVAQRALARIEEHRRLGGDPIQLYMHELAAQSLMQQLADQSRNGPVNPFMTEAAKRVAKAAVRLLDTADTSEVIARVICELHIVAFALGAQVQQQTDDNLQQMNNREAKMPQLTEGGKNGAE